MVDKGRVERARLLLDELADTFDEVERKVIRRWRDSPPADQMTREESYYELRALQGLKRELENVLRAAVPLRGDIPSDRR